MITSAENAGWRTDVAITDPSDCGLRAASVVRPAKLATVGAGRTVQTLGLLGEAEFLAVRKSIIAMFG